MSDNSSPKLRYPEGDEFSVSPREIENSINEANKEYKAKRLAFLEKYGNPTLLEFDEAEYHCIKAKEEVPKPLCDGLKSSLYPSHEQFQKPLLRTLDYQEDLLIKLDSRMSCLENSYKRVAESLEQLDVNVRRNRQLFQHCLKKRRLSLISNKEDDKNKNEVNE